MIWRWFPQRWRRHREAVLAAEVAQSADIYVRSRYHGRGQPILTGPHANVTITGERVMTLAERAALERTLADPPDPHLDEILSIDKFQRKE